MCMYAGCRAVVIWDVGSMIVMAEGSIFFNSEIIHQLYEATQYVVFVYFNSRLETNEPQERKIRK